MRVLFVSGIDGFCHRYGVLHRMAELRTQGIDSSALHFTDGRLAASARLADALILYRVPETSRVSTEIAAARSRGAPVIGAIDDLIFVDDPSAAPAGLDRLAGGDRELWWDGVRRYRRTLLACDRVLVPTAALAAEAEAAGLPGVVVHRDAPSERELQVADEAIAAAAADPRARDRSLANGGAGSVVRIGYFSGTASHDADLAVAAPALAQVLRERPGSELWIVGPVELPAPLTAFGSRVQRRPLVPWSDLPALVRSVDVAIAPLALPGRFAAVKAEVKYIEAAAVAVPLVATPIGAFQYAIRDGETGLLAADFAQWASALDTLVTDPERRVRLGAAAREDLHRRWNVETLGARLAATLHGAAGHRAAPPPATLATRPGGAATWAADGEGRPALEPDARLDVEEPTNGEESPVLCEDRPLRQSFVARRAGLTRVDVHTITHGHALGGEIEVRLRDGADRTLAECGLPARWAADRTWLAIDLPLQEDSAGRCFSLEVRVRGGGGGPGLRLGLASATARTPGITRAPARLGDEALAGPLAMRSFAAWEIARGPLARRGS